MKKILIPTLVLAVLASAVILGASAVRADDFSSSSPLVQKLVERFGLNEDEVVSTFEELRTEKMETMQQSKDERLQSAVDDGVITAEQKEALEAKWAEKKEEMQNHKEEMQAWFEEEGIDHEALREYGGFGHGGHKFHGGFK